MNQYTESVNHFSSMTQKPDRTLKNPTREGNLSILEYPKSNSETNITKKKKQKAVWRKRFCVLTDQEFLIFKSYKHRKLVQALAIVNCNVEPAPKILKYAFKLTTAGNTKFLNDLQK